MSTQIRGAAQAGEHLGFRTTCGRDVRVGRVDLGDAQRPARRVSLDIGLCPGRQDGT